MAMKTKLCFTLLFLSVVLVLCAGSSMAKRDPAELTQCKRQCKVQQQFDEKERKRCAKKCEEFYKDNGEGDREEYEGEEEEEEGEGGENPYVFEAEHFLSKVKTKHGRMIAIPNFSRRSNLLRGIRNYRLGVLQADPETFLTPTHLDANGIFVVSSGQGTITVIKESRRQSFNLEKGVIFSIPAGTTFYVINSHKSEKLDIIQLLQTVNNPGQYEPFCWAAGRNPESFFRTFSSEILEAAFKTSREDLKNLFGRQDQEQGVFVKASREQIRALSDSEESGGIWPFGSQSKGTFRLLKQRSSQSNDYGQLYKADRSDYPPLDDLDVCVIYANISQGGMIGPYFNSESTKIAFVRNGEGWFEMACPHISSSEEQQGRGGGSGSGSQVTYQKVRSRLETGTVYIIPAGHPVAIVASDKGNLEVVGFEVKARNNVRYMLAGRKNVVEQMEKEAKELAFDAKSEEVDRVFGKQEEELFFQGPNWRQQRTGQDRRAYE